LKVLIFQRGLKGWKFLKATSCTIIPWILDRSSILRVLHILSHVLMAWKNVLKPWVWWNEHAICLVLMESLSIWVLLLMISH
jgi:hypothetical protein